MNEYPRNEQTEVLERDLLFKPDWRDCIQWELDRRKRNPAYARRANQRADRNKRRYASK